MVQPKDMFGQINHCVRTLARNPDQAPNQVHKVSFPGGTAYLTGATPGHPARVLVCCVFSRPADLLESGALPPGVLGLSPTQEKVAALLTSRLSNAEIAAELGSSPYTVRRHTEHVFMRLGVKRRGDVAAAIEDRLARFIRERVEQPREARWPRRRAVGLQVVNSGRIAKAS